MSFESRFLTMFRDESKFPEPLFLKKDKRNNGIKRRKSFTDKFFKIASGGSLKLSGINTAKLREKIFFKDKISKDQIQKESYDDLACNSDQMQIEFEHTFSPSSLPPNVECLPLSQSMDSYIPVSSKSSVISLPNYKPLKSPSQHKFRTFRRNDPYFSSYGTIRKEKLNRSRITLNEQQYREGESLYCSSPLSYTAPATCYINSQASSSNSKSVRSGCELKANYYGHINRTDSMVRTNYLSRILPTYGRSVNSNLSKLKFASENCLSKEISTPKVESSLSSDSFSSDNSLPISPLGHDNRSPTPSNDSTIFDLNNELQMKFTKLDYKTDSSANNSDNNRLQQLDLNLKYHKRRSSILCNGSVIPIFDNKIADDCKESKVNEVKKCDFNNKEQTDHYHRLSPFHVTKDKDMLGNVGKVTDSNLLNKNYSSSEINSVRNSSSSEKSCHGEPLFEEIKISASSNDAINDFHKELLSKCANIKAKMDYTSIDDKGKSRLRSNPNLNTQGNTSISSLQIKPIYRKPSISPKPRLLPKPDSQCRPKFSNGTQELNESKYINLPKLDISNKPDKPVKPKHLSETGGSFRIKAPAPEINNNYIVTSKHELAESRKISATNENKAHTDKSPLKLVHLQNGRTTMQTLDQKYRIDEKISSYSSLTNLYQLPNNGLNNNLKVKDLVASFNKVTISSNENLTLKNNKFAYMPNPSHSITQKSSSEFNLVTPCRRNP